MAIYKIPQWPGSPLRSCTQVLMDLCSDVLLWTLCTCWVLRWQWHFPLAAVHNILAYLSLLWHFLLDIHSNCLLVCTLWAPWQRDHVLLPVVSPVPSMVLVSRPSLNIRWMKEQMKEPRVLLVCVGREGLTPPGWFLRRSWSSPTSGYWRDQGILGRKLILDLVSSLPCWELCGSHSEHSE